MLQLALLLLGYALSPYLWTISHTVAGFITLTHAAHFTLLPSQPCPHPLLR